MMNPYLVAIVAFTVVMLGMVFLTTVLFGIRMLATRSKASSVATAEPNALDDEQLAVIVAAAREAIHVPIRVHRVHVHRGGQVEHWSRAGRMDIMISHRVEPKR
jgi:hypothetical protein